MYAICLDAYPDCQTTAAEIVCGLQLWLRAAVILQLNLLHLPSEPLVGKVAYVKIQFIIVDL